MSAPTIGHQIVDEIIKQEMLRVAHPDPDAAHVFVWSANCHDQLDGLVATHTAKLREALLLARCTLAELGAGDHVEYMRVIDDALKS